MALQTRGFALSALQDIPQVPQNIGKVDVGAIYDAASKGVALANLMSSNQQQQEVLGGQRRLALAQQGSEQAQIPSATAAGIAQNTALSQTAPALAGATVAKAGGEVAAQPSATAATIAGNTEKAAVAPSATASQIATNEKTKLDADLANVYTNAGLKYAPDIADSIEATRAGLINSLKNSGGAPVSHAITTPDGRPLGSVIAYADGTGQPHVQFAPMPFGALTRINTGISYQPIGPVNDPETGQPQYDQYQEIMRNAAGGITKGQVVKVAHGEPPPGQIFMGSADTGQTPTGATGPTAAVVPQAGATGPAQVAQTGANAGTATVAPQGASGPVGVAGAAPGGRLGAQMAAKQNEAVQKQRLDKLSELGDERKNISQQAFAIANIANDVQAEQNSALGSNPVSGNLPFRPTVQKVEQDIGMFANQIMSTVKNIRNVNEFRAVTATVPRGNDWGDVQNGKVKYMTDVVQTMGDRNLYQDKLLRENDKLDPDAAEAAAEAKYPFPPVPKLFHGAIAAQASSGATPNPQDAQAVAWARENANDPRAAAILKANGAQ